MHYISCIDQIAGLTVLIKRLPSGISERIGTGDLSKPRDLAKSPDPQQQGGVRKRLVGRDVPTMQGPYRFPKHGNII